VVNGHKSAAHTDSPDGGTGKTGFGRGMHCSKASSFHTVHSRATSIHQNKHDTRKPQLEAASTTSAKFLLP